MSTEAERGRWDGLHRIRVGEGAGYAKDSTYWPAYRDGERMLSAIERSAGQTIEEVRAWLDSMKEGRRSA